MGLYSYIRCEAPLPETPTRPPPGDFQTKDTPDLGLTVYRITADGFLVWRPYRMEVVPKEERPYPDDDGLRGCIGSMRRIEGDEERVDFHGDIRFYTCDVAGRYWWEYRARFTEGRLIRIELEKYEAI